MSFYAKTTSDAQSPRPETAPPGFAGVVSGLRYYDAELGRWLNRDPIELAGGMNLYRFVRNNSIMIIDLYGLWISLINETGEAYYRAESEDTLKELAKYRTGQEDDWQCLWPITVQHPDRYPSVTKCDVYDVSNFSVDNYGELMLDIQAEGQSAVDATGFQDVEASGVANLIRDTSQQGKEPINKLYFHGHGGAGDFGSDDIDGLVAMNEARAMEEGITGYDRVSQQEGPLRCWFTTNAEIRFFGCQSDDLAETFASKALRNSSAALGRASAIGTTAYIGYGGGDGFTLWTQNSDGVWGGAMQSSWAEAEIWGDKHYGGL